ncbi:MAG: peptide chain release factor N(5)-glutamine methyltransferase [Chlamydiota bacterium]
MRLLGEVLNLSIQYLKDKKVESPRLTAELLLAHILKKKRLDLYMQFECPLEEPELEKFRLLIKRASLHEPVEYITSEVEFYGCSFFVSEDVLIPRPETEVLVDKVVKKIEKENLDGKVLWDICAGSGCMGLSIKKKLPLLKVSLSDVSVKALSVCQENAKKNNLDVECLLGDLLSPFKGRKAHYVLCNPPYVTEKEYGGLQPSVKIYEPRQALVGGETGCEFYERLARDLPECLAPRAKVFLELGSGQGEVVNKIFSSPFWGRKELLFDYAGHDRFFFLEIE